MAPTPENPQSWHNQQRPREIYQNQKLRAHNLMRRIHQVFAIIWNFALSLLIVRLECFFFAINFCLRGTNFIRTAYPRINQL